MGSSPTSGSYFNQIHLKVPPTLSTQPLDTNPSGDLKDSLEAGSPALLEDQKSGHRPSERGGSGPGRPAVLGCESTYLAVPLQQVSPGQHTWLATPQIRPVFSVRSFLYKGFYAQLRSSSSNQ